MHDMAGMKGMAMPMTPAKPAGPAPKVPRDPRFTPVQTLNGWTLPWRMVDGVKEFHLVAEPVVREIAPGMKARTSNCASCALGQGATTPIASGNIVA